MKKIQIGTKLTPHSPANSLDADMIGRIRNARTIAVDTETTGLEHDSALLGIGLAWYVDNQIESTYINVGHIEGLFSKPRSREMVARAVDAAFYKKDVIYMANAPFDLGRLLRWGYLTLGDDHHRPHVQDIQILARLNLSMTRRDGVALEKLATRCLGGFPPWMALAKKARSKIYLKTADSVQCYGRADAEFTLLLGSLLGGLMVTNYTPEEKEYLLNRESRFIWLITKIQNTGVLLSIDNIQAHLVQINTRCLELKKEMKERGLINPGSAKAIALALGTYAEMLPTTAKGNIRTDVGSLKDLGHPLSLLIVEWRSLQKAKSTWLEGFVDKIASDGRIHPRFRVAGTISGRISCSSPNLQAVPTNDRGHAYGNLIDVFVAPEGFCLYGCDYKQAELRACAAYAKSEVMAQAFFDGADIHRMTASKMWGCSVEDVTKNQRQTAKNANYTITYGGGARALAEVADIPETQAKQVMNMHRKAFARVARMQVEASNVWEKRGYLKLWSGRKRWRALDEGKYKAFNQLQQGNVAELVKDAMLSIDGYLEDTGYGRVLLQIHDSIEFELSLEHKQEAMDAIGRIMVDAAPDHICARTSPPIVFAVDWEKWYDPTS